MFLRLIHGMLTKIEEEKRYENQKYFFKKGPIKGGIKSESADQFYISKHICQITILAITSCTPQ